MKMDILELLNKLNLIYYRYDKQKNSLLLDEIPNEHSYKELIKITFMLSKHNITFHVNNDKSISLSASSSFISSTIRKYFNTLVENFKNRNSNIYILGNKKVKWAKNLSLFDIEVIPQNIDFSDYDAIIFTSKNGVYSLNKFNSKWKNIPAYVIAPQTAKVVKELKGRLAFVGKSHHGDEFAYELINQLKNKRVLYLKAEKIVSNFTKILNDNEVKCDEKVVYKTVYKNFKEKIELPKDSTIIFSSPSTIECFFKNIIWQKSFKVISIGKTTAKYFPSYVSYKIANTTSLESCVRKAIEIK
ncbi:MAG: uroporphyrinogen-III synthase [Arcobacter sp.]|nr:MAG: uroporphyrinogen-III synthase [Arcobacter sp.]